MVILKEEVMDPWYLSKRFYAALIMIIVSIASLFGYQVDETIQNGIMEALTALGTLISVVLVVWSKLKEKGKNNAASKNP